jgi:hypothetical protein
VGCDILRRLRFNARFAKEAEIPEPVDEAVRRIFM